MGQNIITEKIGCLGIYLQLWKQNSKRHIDTNEQNKEF